MAKPGTVIQTGARCFYCGTKCDGSSQVSETKISPTCESHPFYERGEGTLLWSDEVTDHDVLPECEFVWSEVD